MSRRPCSAAVVAAAAFAGCMGGGDEDESAVAPAPPARPERAFSELRVALGPSFDYVDPALAFTKESWSLLWHVHVPLLVYPHAPGEAGARPAPGLAEDLPEISEDARTYTFRVREGLTYSDGTPVRASDFAFAIERLLRMGSTGSFLFDAIEGAGRVAAGSDTRLRGVVTDDEERTVEFRLTRPQPEFLHALATPLAAPVPRGTREVEQAERPVPATGPYLVAAFEAGERVVLTRNLRYRALPGISPGNPDRIAVSLRGARRADYGAGETVAGAAEPLTAFVFLNVSRPPFDRRPVRQALALALDREALAAAFGARTVVASQLIPPGVPGHTEAQPAEPHLDEARRLLAGSSLPNRRVTVWTSADPQSRRPALEVAETLSELGLRARVRQVPAADFLVRATGRRNAPQLGVATWAAPLPHPRLWIEPLLNGDRLSAAPNTNLPHVDDPGLNDAIAELLGDAVLSAEVAAGWARVDRAAVREAVVVPFAHPRGVHRLGTQVDRSCVVPHVVYGIDLTRLCMRDRGARRSLNRGN